MDPVGLLGKGLEKDKVDTLDRGSCHVGENLRGSLIVLLEKEDLERYQVRGPGDWDT